MPGDKKPRKPQPGIMSFFRRAEPESKPDVPTMPSSSPNTFHTAPSSPTTSNPPLKPTLAAFDMSDTIWVDSGEDPEEKLLHPQTRPKHTLPKRSHRSPAPERSEAPLTSKYFSPPSQSSLVVTPDQPPSSLDRGEVKGSDDEDSDSDSDLMELADLLQSNHSSGSRPKTNYVPTTPVPMKETRRSAKFHESPLPVLPKYKFDIKSLLDDAAKNDATEATAARVKAMMAPPAAPTPTVGDLKSQITKRNDLLQSIVGDADEDAQRITRAVDRTEATLPEYRWYFFDTQYTASKPEQAPFPDMFVSDEWRNELEDPQQRYLAFVSGFAEDRVTFGSVLPDEIFMWMIDEICLEPNEVLRTSYCSVMRQSKKQVERLLVPSTVNRMFQNLGGVSNAIDITHKLHPVPEIVTPYRKNDWAKLRSVMKFLGLVSSSMQQESREHIICMILRMSADRVISENVDNLDLVQEVIFRLCRCIPEESWNASCKKICTNVFNNLELSTLRLQVVESISSISPTTHDLRRRLAMTFCFNSPLYSTTHPHTTMSLAAFTTRIDSADFAATSNTDFRELAALISLLDIAVDDGRSLHLDLTNHAVEAKFDNDIEEFAGKINGIIKAIGNPGTAFISKIEAKEHLLLVSQRIADTVRSRPKPKKSFMDDTMKEERKRERGLEAQRNAMKSFTVKKERRLRAEDVW